MKILGSPTARFAPTTHGVGLDQTFFSLDAQAGRPLVLALLGRLGLANASAALSLLRTRAAAFASAGADIVALVEIEAERAQDYFGANAPGVRIVFSSAEVFAGWGFAHEAPALAALDGAGRLLAGPLPLDAETVDAVLTRLAEAPREAPFDDLAPAPVLAIPDLVDAQLCRELIAHFEASDPAFGGMASVDASGAAIHKIDGGKKHRYDLVLGPRDPYLNKVLAAILTRCLPEIKKAFQVDIRHTDRILLARYDASGGYFKRHRDNSAAPVAYRQFALSINLNDDYDGGCVLFPEYNLRRYRPRAGAGVAFSCSLLHEATPVTRGRRYCALTFLHDAAAQALSLSAAAQARSLARAS